MFSKFKNLLCGILVITSLSSGFAHAYDQKQENSNSEYSIENALREGIRFVSEYPHLYLFLGIAPYLGWNRANVFQGMKYGAKLFPLTIVSCLAIKTLLPESVTKKELKDGDSYDMDFYSSAYLAPVLEEIFFRGIIQNISMFPAHFFPLLTEPLLFLNACVFGFAHAFNGHSGAYVQGSQSCNYGLHKWFYAFSYQPWLGLYHGYAF